MEVLGKQLGGAVDSSVIDFRNEVIMELEKCVKEPFAMNPTSEARLFGQQEALNQIIEYLKYII